MSHYDSVSGVEQIQHRLSLGTIQLEPNQKKKYTKIAEIFKKYYWNFVFSFIDSAVVSLVNVVRENSDNSRGNSKIWSKKPAIYSKNTKKISRHCTSSNKS